MAYPGRVHIAERKHEEELMVLCHQLADENGMFTMSETKVRDVLRKAFNRQGGIIGIIGGEGEKIEGMVYLLVDTLWYTDETSLQELFLYVAPEGRRAKTAIELMKFAKWCAEQSGFSLLIGVISNQRTAGKIRLYKKQFPKEEAGNFFVYRSNRVTETIG